MRNRAREVIDVLSEFGWGKGGYVGDEEGFCMLGALAFNEIGVCKELEISKFYNGWSAAYDAVHPTIQILNEIIAAEYPDALDTEQYQHHIPTFNDDCETSLDDVYRVLEKAAAKIDEIVE